MKEALNLSADLVVSGQPPVSYSNVTRLGLHYQHTWFQHNRLQPTPPRVTLPANFGASAQGAASDPHRFYRS